MIAAALAPVERLGAARVAQEVVAAAVVEVAQHHVGDSGRVELRAGDGAVGGLLGPLLAGQGGVDQQQVGAPVGGGAKRGHRRGVAIAGGEGRAPDRGRVVELVRLDRVAGEEVHVRRPLGALPGGAGQVRVVVSRSDQHRHTGGGEAVAQERDRVLADVVVLVDVAGDADRIDPGLASERERAGHGVAQLGPAADGRRPRLGAVKDAIEVDVGDVQKFHWRTPKCRYDVGWSPAGLTGLRKICDIP